MTCFVERIVEPKRSSCYIARRSGPVAVTFPTVLLGAGADRPTNTYKPMTGPAFRKAIMSPLPLRSVALAIDSGVSAQFLMNLGVRSINGLRNSILGPGEHLEADSRFTRAVSVLSRLQLINAVHVRVASAQPGVEHGEISPDMVDMHHAISGM